MCAVKIGRIGKFDLNPRGNLWVKDENRFGHKLLSKMGWSQGKGLGKNESGITENLKVRMKMGNTGVGWDEKLPIAIDYRDCDAVLEDLTKRYQKAKQGKNEEEGLEKRSQQFKNRIHYQKFVRGKDTSRYSEKDMSCIFLSRPEIEKEPPSKETTVTNIESRPAEISSEESVPTFNSQLTMADYFAMKMKNKIGSSNTPKESESCEGFSQAESEVSSKKRKQELKRSKKAKRIKLENEISNINGRLFNEEDTSESSSTSQDASEDNADTTEQFQNLQESYSCEDIRKKRKLNKKSRKLLNVCKSDPNVDDHSENNLQIENGMIQENCSAYKSLTFNLCQESSNSNEDFKNIENVEVVSKKRKKEQNRSKKLKKCLLDTEISIEKDSSHTESDDVDKNSEDATKILEIEKQSHKESKRHKKEKMSNLKSCLKSKKYNFNHKLKEVSFDENISYRIIEDDCSNLDSDIVLETNEQLLSCSDEDCADDNILIETEAVTSNHNGKSNSSNKSSDEQCNKECDQSNDSLQENQMHANMAEDNEVPECFKLPKCSNANFNNWLETQRIATRMKIYKNMVKKIRKHPFLKTTNILQIKGYGNWGL